MRTLVTFAISILRSALALLRSREEQAIVELALRQQLATYALENGHRQRWITFLRNHKDAIAGMDCLVVPTIRFRLLYVWFVIDHGRRRILHFNVTTNPTAHRVIQQLREAFPYQFAPGYLIYDNDSIFSDRVTESIEQLPLRPKRTAYRSPWQNGTAERWVGRLAGSYWIT